MLYSGTDPESYITEYTSLYEDNWYPLPPAHPRPPNSLTHTHPPDSLTHSRTHSHIISSK